MKITWPDLNFGPINLWNAWKLFETKELIQAPVNNSKIPPVQTGTKGD